MKKRFQMLNWQMTIVITDYYAFTCFSHSLYLKEILL